MKSYKRLWWGKVIADNLLTMSNEISGESFENLSYEDRTFTPSQSFIDNANTKSDIYDEANKDRLAFWEKQANRLSWDKKWNQVVDWQLPVSYTHLTLPTKRIV